MTRWLWTDANGAVTTLSAWDAGNYVTADGTTATVAPVYDYTTQRYAGADGETVQQIVAQAGSPVLGVQLTAADPVELRNRIRGLAHTLRPKLGPGTLTAVADDGTTRNLRCRYLKGLEAAIQVGTTYRAAVAFHAESPWWRGDPYAYTWTLAGGTSFFPILPIVLSASTITGQVTVDLSDTDNPTYPRWLVTGPGSQLTLGNSYTQVQPDGSTAAVTRQLVLNAPIGDGQLVVIDTRPGFQAINAATPAAGGGVVLGVSLFGALATDPDMWPLIDGVQAVSAVLTNAGAASSIRVTADRLYGGAY